MTTAPAPASHRLHGAVDYIPAGSLTPEALRTLARFVADLDALGRVELDTGRPMVDEHTLRGLLRGVLPRDDADGIVDLLLAIPGKAIRQRAPDAQALEEVGWVELAATVPIFDAEIEGFTRLGRLPARTTTNGMVIAANDLCRSLERELLDPGVLPPVLMGLARPCARDRTDTVLREVTRQLGWWAALTTVLLLPLAAATTGPAHGRLAERADPNLWPVGMLVYATVFGGWTLTVVGSCVLASRSG